MSRAKYDEVDISRQSRLDAYIYILKTRFQQDTHHLHLIPHPALPAIHLVW
jgi:hypothetical protein